MPLAEVQALGGDVLARRRRVVLVGCDDSDGLARLGWSAAVLDFLGEGALPFDPAASSTARSRCGSRARTNLDWFGIDAAIRRVDARRLGDWDATFDAVVTDVPYGRSASLRGADTSSLYEKFLRSAADVLRPGGRAVVMAPALCPRSTTPSRGSRRSRSTCTAR